MNKWDRSDQIRLFFRSLAIALAILQTFAARNSISPDGRSYLDLGQAYLHHDWAMAINGYWGPFYAWMLTFAQGVFKPSLRWEYPVAHILNACIFILTIAAFEFFWTSALSYRNSFNQDLNEPSLGLTNIQLWTLGYSLFIWLTINNLLSVVNPDLCLATIVLVIAASVTRIKLNAGKNAGMYVQLGVALGLAYLIKAVMFPMGLIFLIVVFALHGTREHRKRIIVCAVMFLIICTPQILLLSHVRKHLTFSDTGKLAFLWYNYDLPLRDWQGSQPNSGTPLHPTRVLWRNPDVFEFDGPIRASYPPWYDPGYWNDGMSSPLRVGAVIRHTVPRIVRILAAFAEPKAWLVAVVLLLLLSNLKRTMRALFNYWYLIIPSVAIMGMYSLTWVDDRYLAVWLLLIWAAVLFSIEKSAKFVKAEYAYSVLTFLVFLGLTSAVAYGSYGQLVHGRRDDARQDYATAEGLSQLGLRPSDKVTAIGFDNDAHWAYLDRVSVVAEINSDETCKFWSAPSLVQNQILEKLASVNVKAVVANLGDGVMSTSGTPKAELQKCAIISAGWREIPGSRNQVFILH